jgi:deoxyribodipyrimidine photolyase-related protein
MTSCFVILPIHLFEDINTLEKTIIDNNISTIYIIEEPVYFGSRQSQLNFNKLKLIYHRASIKYFYDYLHTNLHNKKLSISLSISIKFLDFAILCKTKGYSEIKSHSNIYMYNPIDTYLEAKYAKIFAKKLVYLDSPLFLCDTKSLEVYHNTKPKATRNTFYNHASFYKWQRERLNILATSKTYDTDNRNMMPLDTQVPPLPKNDSSINQTNNKYIVEAISYVEKLFPNNLEPIYDTPKPITPDAIHFPITHKTSALWLENFCNNRLSNFGKYEDSIDSIPRNFLFHSTISPMLNIGLLTPMQVINTITKYYESHKKTISIASYEAFIRQVIGWREYQRYIYVYAGDIMRKSNHFGNNRRLTDSWYKATTGIKPVDDAIKLAINDGYIHHILRLMVIGNFMNLVGIHPDDVYKWFMEFSLDSYDWVMIGNVYSMTLWADGGMSMRKPYISGSGYIMKMSNYARESKAKLGNNMSWQDKWDVVFHNFIDRNSEALSRTYYNGVVKAWVRKDKVEKEKEIKTSNEIIASISK